MKILIFGDIHFHHTHRFSHITDEGFSIRELEHISCADDILNIYKKYKYDKIVFLGDMWGPVGDTMSAQTLKAITVFLKKLVDICPVDIIIGNHDLSSICGKNSCHKLSAFENWNNITIYDKLIESGNFIYLPYCIDTEYVEAFLEAIPNKKDKIIFSHMEIKGIQYANGFFTDKGLDLELLKQFKFVFQGHYHSGGKFAKNIFVTGSTQRLSFKDKGISRNNIILYDTDTAVYKRESFNCPDWLSFDDYNLNDILDISSNNYVKLNITSDILLTDKIKSKLNEFKGTDIHIDLTRLSVNKKINEFVDDTEDPSTILTDFITQSDNEATFKKDLISEGKRLIESIK